MLNCNHCTLDLCAVLVCDNRATITFPATAPMDGTYKLVLEYLNTAKVYEGTFTSGSPMIFDVTNLNENYCFEGYIVGSDGVSVTLFDNGQGYGSFRFCTHPEIQTAVI